MAGSYNDFEKVKGGNHNGGDKYRRKRQDCRLFHGDRVRIHRVGAVVFPVVGAGYVAGYLLATTLRSVSLAVWKSAAFWAGVRLLHALMASAAVARIRIRVFIGRQFAPLACHCPVFFCHASRASFSAFVARMAAADRVAGPAYPSTLTLISGCTFIVS